MERLRRVRLSARWRLVSALAAASLVSGCGGNVMQTLGLVPSSPNAFLVTTQPPLAIPQNLNKLPPPQPGAERPQAVSARLRAEETLVPEIALAGAAGPDSSGQRALVAAAGPPAPADIGAELAKEKTPQQSEEGPLSWLLFWRPSPPPGVVVDPVKEARRLQMNAALGRPPTYGQTPIIQPRQQGIF
ncbi:MAG: DUF3035 domain-containing protein [Acetobacteraceae bacterium]